MGVYVYNLSMRPKFYVGLRPVFEAVFDRKVGRFSGETEAKLIRWEEARMKNWMKENPGITWGDALLARKDKDGCYHVTELMGIDKSQICYGSFEDVYCEKPVGTMKFTGRGRSSRKIWTEA